MNPHGIILRSLSAHPRYDSTRSVYTPPPPLPRLHEQGSRQPDGG